MSKIDPRTHFVVLMVISTLTFLHDKQWQFYVLLGFSALYMALNHLWKRALGAIIMYVIIILLLQVVPNVLPAMAVFLFIMSRIFPAFMIGSVLISSPGSRILYMLDYAKMPKPILIIIMIFLRFFPTILKEIQTIYQGIKVRGVFPTPLHIVKKPLVAYECMVVPLMFRCLKLSSELAAAAEIRGIESTRKRTTIYETKFKQLDFIALLSMVILIGVIYMGGLYD